MSNLCRSYAGLQEIIFVHCLIWTEIVVTDVLMTFNCLFGYLILLYENKNIRYASDGWKVFQNL